MGLLDLVFARFVFVVTEREIAAASLMRSVSVYRIVKVRPVQIWKKSTDLSLDEEEHQQICIASINEQFCTGSVYFSMDVDLTNGPQSGFNRGLKALSTLTDSETYFATINDRFCWNKYMLEPLLGQDALQFILPVICGHVGSAILELDGPEASLIFVSRLNRHRAGTRYWSRGVDSDGHTAMEVESDILVVYQGGIASFCMIRGSVPLFWSQSAIRHPVKRPEIDLLEATTPDSIAAMKRHFEYLMSTYGSKVDIIDMLDRKSREPDISGLSHAYESAVKEWDHPSIRYLKRDVLMTDKSMEELMRDIPELVDNQGFFHAKIDEKGTFKVALRKQLGVIRFNGLDCIEETSIAQFLIVKHTLKILLKEIGVWAPKRKEFDPRSSYWIHQLWGDNTDALCLFYTGTTMRHSFRIRQTYFSKLMDPVLWPLIELSRTYMSVFEDYERHDKIKFFLGQLVNPPLRHDTNGTPQLITPWISNASDIVNTSPESERFKEQGMVQAEISLRRRIRLSEYSHPVFVATILLLRNLMAPKKITTTLDILLAVFWMLIYWVCICVLRYPSSIFIRKPREHLDFSALPLIKSVALQGVAVCSERNQQLVIVSNEEIDQLHVKKKYHTPREIIRRRHK